MDSSPFLVKGFYMKKFFFFLVMLIPFLSIIPQVEVLAKVNIQSEQEVKEKLEHFAKEYLCQANKNLKCNRDAKFITKVGDEFIAKFHEVDIDSLSIELYPSSSSKSILYVGYVIYIEKCYECRAKTKVEAEQGNFKVTAGRRVRELARFTNGKWII
ncbi:hypothetical protein BW722_04880 [Lawsonia intracellularis]|nr:hypothetical protein BW722_04880 [Lawsonia intracellularis]